MVFVGLSSKQREVLILTRQGFKDQQIATLLGNKQRADICRMRRRARKIVAGVLAACGNPMTIDEAIASITRASPPPAPLALAS